MKPSIHIVVSLLLLGIPALAAQENTAYTYDDAGRLAAAYTSAGTTNSVYVYQYDRAGNRTRFDSYAPAATNDLDGDTLDDQLELGYFHHLDENPTTDPDGDGLVNSNEFAASGNPTEADTDSDWMGDNEEFIAGTALDDATEYFHVTNTLAVGSRIHVMCDTKAGRTYQLQTCPQLGGTWTDEGSPVAPGAGSYFWDVIASTSACFRVGVYITP